MTTSKYFRHWDNTEEQDLYHDLAIETIQIQGFDQYYIFRDTIEIDPVLFEPTKSEFKSAFQIEMAYPDHRDNGWDGNELMTEFGLSIKGKAKFNIARRRWEDVMKTRTKDGEFSHFRPREGDLIYALSDTKTNVDRLDMTIFQITYVEPADQVRQLGDYYWFTCHCEVYRASKNENISTGISLIDGVISSAKASEIDKAQNSATDEVFDDLQEFDANKDDPFGGF